MTIKEGNGAMRAAVMILVWGAAGRAARRLRLLRLTGMKGAAQRRYRRAAWLLGGVTILAMAVQEAVLLAAGQLSWATGLPLHLCSLTGVLILPALLTRHEWLLHAALYAGVPGAVLALLFPAVLDTPWPLLTALAFHTMHACIPAAVLLPLGMGWRPKPVGAAQAGAILAAAGCAALTVNRLTGGNYLFLSGAIGGTPLALLAKWGMGWYRVLLAGTAAAVLAAEAALIRALNRWQNLNRILA